VTRMLAERVGPTGHVLATDLDPRLLEPLAGGNVEVVRHDLLADPLPEAAFDLVHARLLLMHLPTRLEAPRRMVGARRPGGWLAVIDVDFGTVRISPPSLAWERTWSACLDTLVAADWDPRYGTRLYDDLEALGLDDVEVVSDRYRGRAGRDLSELLSLTIERLRPRIVAAGATDEEIDEGRRLLADPAARFDSPTTFVATARRPR